MMRALCDGHRGGVVEDIIDVALQFLAREWDPA